MATWDDLKRSVAANGSEQPFRVGLERGGQPMTVTVAAEGMVFAYTLPLVLFGSALYELLHRRHP